MKEQVKTGFVLAFFVAAVVIGLVSRFYMPAPKPATTETFMQQEVGKPLSDKGMGPYDGLGSGMAGWAAAEPMPVSQAPANNPLDPNKLMFMVDNTVSNQCCPSTFNTDTGCVCLSEENRRLFASRGGNRA